MAGSGSSWYLADPGTPDPTYTVEGSDNVGAGVSSDGNGGDYPSPDNGWGFNQPTYNNNTGGQGNTDNNLWDRAKQLGYGALQVEGKANKWIQSGQSATMSVLDMIAQTYSNVLSRPTTTLLNATNRLQPGTYGDLGAAWKSSEYVSPAQAGWAYPESIGGQETMPFMGHILHDAIGSEYTDAEKAGKLDFTNRKQTEDFFNHDSVLGDIATGATDVAYQAAVGWYADPVVLAGYAARASRIAAVGKLVDDAAPIAEQSRQMQEWHAAGRPDDALPAIVQQARTLWDAGVESPMPARAAGGIDHDLPSIITGGVDRTVNPLAPVGSFVSQGLRAPVGLTEASATDSLLATGKAMMNEDLRLLPTGWAVPAGRIDSASGELIQGLDEPLTGYRLTHNNKLVQTNLDSEGFPETAGLRPEADKGIPDHNLQEPATNDPIVLPVSTHTHDLNNVLTHEHPAADGSSALHVPLNGEGNTHAYQGSSVFDIEAMMGLADVRNSPNYVDKANLGMFLSKSTSADDLAMRALAARGDRWATERVLEDDPLGMLSHDSIQAAYRKLNDLTTTGREGPHSLQDEHLLTVDETKLATMRKALERLDDEVTGQKRLLETVTGDGGSMQARVYPQGRYSRASNAVLNKTGVVKAMTGGVAGEAGEGARLARQVRNVDMYWFQAAGAAGRWVGVVHRATDEVPDGIIRTKGIDNTIDSTPAAAAIVRAIPFVSQRADPAAGRVVGRNTGRIEWHDGLVQDGPERGRWMMNEFNRQKSVIGESADVAATKAVYWLEQEMMRSTLTANGIRGAAAAKIMEDYVAKIHPIRINAQKEAAKTGFAWKLNEKGEFDPVKDPIVTGHLENHYQVIQPREFQRSLESPSFFEGYAKAGARGITKFGDAAMNVWKPLVLARPLSYPIRNVFIEATSRLVATLGMGYFRLISHREGSAGANAENAERMAEQARMNMHTAFTQDRQDALQHVADAPHLDEEIRRLANEQLQADANVHTLHGQVEANPYQVVDVLGPDHQVHSMLGAALRPAFDNGATHAAPVRVFGLDESTLVDPDRVLAHADEMAKGNMSDLPVVIGLDPETGEARIIDGVHRVVAAQHAGVSHVPIRIVADDSGQGLLFKTVRQDVTDFDIHSPMRPVPVRPSVDLIPARDGSHLLPGEMPPVASLVATDGSGYLVKRRGGDNEPWAWIQARAVSKDDDIANKIIDDSGRVYVLEERGRFASPEHFKTVREAELTDQWSKGVGKEGEPIDPEVVFPGQQWTVAGSAERHIEDADAIISKTMDKIDAMNLRSQTSARHALSLALARQAKVHADVADALTRAQILSGSGVVGVSPEWDATLGRLPDATRAALGDIAQMHVALAQHRAMVSHAEELAAHLRMQEAANLRPHQSAGGVTQTGRLSVLGRRGQLRAGEGVRTTVVNGVPFTHGGIFSGAFGNIARGAVSADETQKAFISSGRGAMEAALTQSPVLKNAMLRHDDDPAGYWQAVADVVNRTFINSPAVKMIASVPPEQVSAVLPRYKQWVLSRADEAAAKEFDMFIRPNLAASGLSAERLVEQQFYREAEHVNSLVPNGPVRDKIAQGVKADADELKNTVQPGKGGYTPVSADKIDGSTGFHYGVKDAAHAGRKLTNWLFKWIGTMPEDTFARMPFAVDRFNHHMDVLLQKAITVGGDTPERVNMLQLQRKATAAATADVRKTLYTLERKHRSLESIRLISAFAEAQYNSLSFWGRMLAQNPQYIGRIAALATLPQREGMVDENGKVAIPVPGFLRGITPNHSDEWTFDPRSIINIYGNVENKDNPLLGAFLPGPSPWVTLGGSELSKHRDSGSALDWFSKHVPGGALLTNQLLGPAGPSQEEGSWDRILPPSMTKLWHYLDANSDDDGYITGLKVSAFEQRYTRWMLNGKQGPEPQVDDDETRNMVKGQILLSFFTGLISPVGGTWKDSTTKHLSNIYQMYKENYGGEADRMMMQKFPEAVGLIASSRGKAKTSATWDSIKFMDDHADFLSKIGKIDPRGPALLTPYSKGFDPVAYRYQQANTVPGTKDAIRPNLTPEQAQRQFEADVAFHKWSVFKDKLDVERQQNGWKIGDPGYAAGKQRTKDYIDELKKQYKGFAQEWDGPAPTSQGLSILHELAGASGDFAKDNQLLVSGAQEILNARQKAQDQIAALPKFDPGYAGQNAIKDNYQSRIDSLSNQDERIGRIMSNYMYRDEYDKFSTPNPTWRVQ